MSLISKVYGSLRWKKSDEYCSSKLGISLSKYKEIKQQIKSQNFSNSSQQKDRVVEFNENLDKGTAEIKGITTTEPRTSEDIIKLLKIDITQWKLSSYWNKEKHDGWYVSALVSRIKKEQKDILAEVVENFNPIYQPTGEIHLNKTFTKDSVGVLSTQDLHFGKEGNADITKNFKEAVKDLVHRSYASHYMDKIIYVIGGDLLNMDTFNGTTTSGTPVDNDQRAHIAYTEAFDALYWSINYIKQFCENLHIVYLPGNHDRLSSYHIVHALSKCFDSEDFSIYFDAQYAERKVIVYGNNFFAFEHGDVTKKNTALIYATEFPTFWGATKYRTCYTGHFHSKKTIEYVTENEHNGFSIKHLPSLSSTDYWHYHNKFTGSKCQAIIEIHDKWKGKVSEFIYTI